MLTTRRSRERGAAMVEAALVMPILALLVFAAIDGSVFMKSYMSLGHATTNGARADVTKANHPLADYDMLQAVAKTKYGFDTNSIERIVVFKATSFDDAPPTQCMTNNPHGIPNLCNVYVPADFARASTDFGGDSTWDSDQSWPAWLREASRSNNPDLVGVAIRGKVSTPIGVFGKRDFTVTRTRVMQIEARTS